MQPLVLTTAVGYRRTDFRAEFPICGPAWRKTEDVSRKMEEDGRTLAAAVRTDLGAELSRRDFLGRAAGLGVGAVVLGALPVVERMAGPRPAFAQAPVLAGATLQAFFDTIIPGRRVPSLKTELGNPIHRKAIAGVDREHGAVFTDALLLAHNPKIGFDALEPAFLAELESFSLEQGGRFVDLGYTEREAVCLRGLDFSNQSRQVWEAAAAVAFSAFCAAANVPNATRYTSAGYRVMGHPGTAPHGYDDFSYRRVLNRGRTRTGSLP
jgi:hypothetical protein